jgi:hypothetical protein
MIKIRQDKINEMVSLFEKSVGAGSISPAPWQNPERVDGVSIFPEKNDRMTLEYFLLLGALNFSYWQSRDGQVETWGVNSSRGEKVIDVFALAFCLSESVERGLLKLESEFYCDISKNQLEQVFADRQSGKCEIPMLEQRLKKVRELGRGLKNFAAEHGLASTTCDFLQSCDSLPELLIALAKYFPYSFGDPFRKLPQLFFKMIRDRRPENLPSGFQFENKDCYLEATEFAGGDSLKAQPDYMLPLFCLKTGIWEIDEQVKSIFKNSRRMPMDHPVELAIRGASVETVDLIADGLPGERGINCGRVDSIMWQTAVEGCFPVNCEGCNFSGNCDAVNKKNERLYWAHHLTRTINY